MYIYTYKKMKLKALEFVKPIEEKVDGPQINERMIGLIEKGTRGITPRTNN